MKQGNQRTKGHTFERAFAKWFRERYADFKVVAKRGWQSRMGGKEEADVETFMHEKPIPLHWELMHGKAPSVWAKYKQACDDAKPGEIPIAVVKRNREKPRVFMDLEDFGQILEPWLRERYQNGVKSEDA